MRDHEDEPIILQGGEEAEDAFRFEVTRHILGRRIKGLTYCGREEIVDEGRPTVKQTVRLDFEDGGFMVVSMATDADVDIWVSRKDQPEQTSKWKM